MKKVMILGAGIYQVPLIKKAKEMGYYTIVVSVEGNYPGFGLADEIYYENTVDKEKVLDIARAEEISSIMVCGTDVCVPTQGYVCDQLNLSGLSYEAALIAQDKALMKAAFRDNGVRTAPFEYVDIDNDDPVDVCERIGYPVIFKSVDSSGSRGITKVENESEIAYAYSQVKANTRTDRYIVEKYLVGFEYGAQSMISNGKIMFILPHGDYVFQGDTGVPIGHFAPFDLPNEVIDDCSEQLNAAIKAMKLDNCAINADFILCDGKTYVLELGARAGATCLVEMTSIYYGIDYYEKIIQLSLGEEPDFTPGNEKRRANAEMLFMADKTGILKLIECGEIDDERIVQYSFDYKEGERVRKFAKGPDRIGHIIAEADTVEEAKAAIDKATEKIHFVIE